MKIGLISFHLIFLVYVREVTVNAFDKFIHWSMYPGHRYSTEMRWRFEKILTERQMES